VYFSCQRLPYGKEDQTLLIDDEPNKAFQNSKSSGFFFLECVMVRPFLRLWLALIGLHFASTIEMHFQMIKKKF
jgi:hypothetical protein